MIIIYFIYSTLKNRDQGHPIVHQLLQQLQQFLQSDKGHISKQIFAEKMFEVLKFLLGDLANISCNSQCSLTVGEL